MSTRKATLRFGTTLVGAVCLLCGGFLADVKAEKASVTDVRVWSTPRYARVVIHLKGRAPFAYDRLGSPDRIYVDIQGAALRLGKKDRTIEGKGVLKAVRIGLNTRTIARIVLDLKAIESYRVFSLAAPSRIVVDVEAPPPKAAAEKPKLTARKPPPVPEPKPNSPSAPEQKARRTLGEPPVGSPSVPPESVKAPSPPPKREAAVSPDEMSLAERFRRGLGKIVLDPGHGGKDPGAVGVVRGIYEKDIVLDISKRMARILRRDLKAKVLLTRTRDVFIPLEERTAFANAHRADLFVSIHANSSPGRRLSGLETYLLSEATDERALKVAARENGVSTEELSDLQIILSDLRTRGVINRSLPLAESVQKTMFSTLTRRYSGVRDLGVKQAPFYVLMGAQMPSILVEVGFLSNRLGERRLRSSKYRQVVATSISVGVRKFVERTQLARELNRPR
ncbi:MAG: N-acetylmuramoyl-L-alanine amidase [Nitrospinota bacterium]